MILVDTSTWVNFFNRGKSTQARQLKELIEQGEDICLVDLMLTEILQGVKEDKIWELSIK